MKTYIINFKGRLKSSIGITYKITEIIQASNEASAEMELYKKYDHISNLIIIDKEQKARETRYNKVKAKALKQIKTFGY